MVGIEVVEKFKTHFMFSKLQ